MKIKSIETEISYWMSLTLFVAIVGFMGLLLVKGYPEVINKLVGLIIAIFTLCFGITIGLMIADKNYILKEITK